MQSLFQHFFLECKLVILLQDDIAVTFNASEKKKKREKMGTEGVKAKQHVCSLLHWSFPADPKQSFFFLFCGSSESPCFNSR